MTKELVWANLLDFILSQKQAVGKIYYINNRQDEPYIFNAYQVDNIWAASAKSVLSDVEQSNIGQVWESVQSKWPTFCFAKLY